MGLVVFKSTNELMVGFLKHLSMLAFQFPIDRVTLRLGGTFFFNIDGSLV